MSKTVTIDLVVGDPSKVDAMFDKWDKGLKSIQDQTDKIKAAMSGVYMPPPGGGGGFRRRGASGPGGNNVLDDLQKARVASAVAKANGGDPYWRNQASGYAQLSINSLQKQALAGDMTAVTKLNQAVNLQKRNSPNSTMSKIQDAFMTSRMGMGAGGLQIMPLVNKLSAIHPAAAVVVGALTMLGQGISKTYDDLNKRLNQSASYGAGAKDVDRVASWLGLDGDAVIESMRGAVESSDLAKSYAMQAGVNPVQGVHGSMDFAKDTLKQMALIANAKSYDEARKMAYEYKQPELANLHFASQQMKDEIKVASTEMNPQQKQAQMKLNDDLYAIQKMFNEGVKGFVAPFFELASSFSDFQRIVFGDKLQVVSKVAMSFTWLASGLTLTIKVISEFFKGLTAIITFLKDKFPQILGANAAKDAADTINDADKQQEKSQKDLTLATIQLTSAIKQGINGGGARVRSAIPGQVQSTQLNDKAYRDALKDGIL
jgi:hypothetical protein